MKTISILSQKGGAGKTTIALNIAVAADLKGDAVAVLDLDPQCSATEWGDSRDSETPVVKSIQAARLPNILEKCKENGAELAIIDTMPKVEQDSLRAARLSDLVLIPCRPSILDLRAIRHSFEICQTVGVPALAILNQVPHQGALPDEAEEAIRGMGLNVLPLRLGQRIAYVHALTNGQGVQEYEPHGKAAKEIKKLHTIITKELGKTNNEQSKKGKSKRRAA